MRCLLAMLLAFPLTAHAADVVVPSISVTGFAEAKLAPNQAVLSLTVHSENVKLDVAKKEQDKKVKEVIAITEKLGIKADDVKTQYANVQPVYDYNQNGKPKFRNYSLDNQIEIKMDKLETAGPLMDALTNAGFDRIGGLGFGLKDEREQREALLAQALGNAKDKAQKMAAALGVKIGKPITINESGAYTPQPVVMAKAVRAEMAVADAGSMPTYSPTGLIEIQQTVNVTFGIE
jgi:uncharacterized protein